MSLKPKTVGRYRRLDKIGYGNFGVVYKGVDTATNKVVAIKTLDLDTVEDEVDSVQHEVSLLSHLSSTKSTNVTKYYGTVLDGSKLWIVMDFCSGGSVRTLLKAGLFEDKYLSVLFREITIAVHAIHSEGIIHRDLKAANVLITLSGQVKLCDFGVAAVSRPRESSKRNTVVGTPYWMAPEVITEGQSYTNKADIWSLGITFYEIVTGNPPYAGHEAMRALMIITSSRPPRLEGPKYTPSLKDLIALCLDEDPKARPSAEEILKHRFLKLHVKTSTVVLKNIVEKYVQWKRINQDHRDSLLMFNPHRDEEDLETSSETESLWDFGVDEAAANDNQPVPMIDDMNDAPNSFRELFGIPPQPANDNSPLDLPMIAPRSSDEDTTYSNNSTPMGPTPVATMTKAPALPDNDLDKLHLHSNEPPMALPISRHKSDMDAHIKQDTSQVFGAHETGPQHRPSAPQTHPHPRQVPSLPAQSQSQSAHLQSLLNQGQSQTTQLPSQLHLHQGFHQAHLAHSTSAMAHQRAQPVSGFIFPQPEKSADDITRVPAAVMMTRSRSTTVGVSSPSQVGSWKGWRARHGSELQLDQLKRPTQSNLSVSSNVSTPSNASAPSAVTMPSNTSTSSNGSAPNTAVPSSSGPFSVFPGSGSGDDYSDLGTASPKSGLSRHNSVSERYNGERHPSASIQASQAAQAAQQAALAQAAALNGTTSQPPVHIKQSPSDSPSSSPPPASADRSIDAPAEKMVEKPPPLSAATGSVSRPGRASLPRLQMPPRPMMKPTLTSTSTLRSKRPTIWPSEFPPMPQLDLNTLLDSTPDDLVVATLLELTIGYKTAISSLAGQFE